MGPGHSDTQDLTLDLRAVLSRAGGGVWSPQPVARTPQEGDATQCLAQDTESGGSQGGGGWAAPQQGVEVWGEQT